MNSEVEREAGIGEDAIRFYRRLDTLLWSVVGLAVVAVASILWGLKVDSVLMKATQENTTVQLAQIQAQLTKMAETLPVAKEQEARIKQLEKNFETLWPWRRAAQSDISALWRASTLTGAPKSGDISQ